jgi:hypothetical protein
MPAAVSGTSAGSGHALVEQAQGLHEPILTGQYALLTES